MTTKAMNLSGGLPTLIKKKKKKRNCEGESIDHLSAQSQRKTPGSIQNLISGVIHMSKQHMQHRELIVSELERIGTKISTGSNPRVVKDATGERGRCEENSCDYYPEMWGTQE